MVVPDLQLNINVILLHNKTLIGNFSIPKISGLRVFNPGISELAIIVRDPGIAIPPYRDEARRL